MGVNKNNKSEEKARIYRSRQYDAAATSAFELLSQGFSANISATLEVCIELKIPYVYRRNITHSLVSKAM